VAERNRVTPFGEIVAIKQRGLFMGNRGSIPPRPVGCIYWVTL
jgi:hypothetical protein